MKLVCNIEMDIRFEPYDLQINDITVDTCPCCNMILQRNIRKGRYLIGGECRSCRWNDKMFSGWSSYNRYGDCSCQYREKDFLYITCENCKSAKCIDCQKPIRCYNKNCSIPTRCCDCRKKYEFIITWKTTTPQEKLNLYGIKKLQILAKNKKIKGFSKYKKQEIIDILSPLVNENDFPIK
jgi:hypothetical protein